VGDANFSWVNIYKEFRYEDQKYNLPILNVCQVGKINFLGDKS